jgi:hypothetical protein
MSTSAPKNTSDHFTLVVLGLCIPYESRDPRARFMSVVGLQFLIRLLVRGMRSHGVDVGAPALLHPSLCSALVSFPVDKAGVAIQSIKDEISEPPANLLGMATIAIGDEREGYFRNVHTGHFNLDINKALSAENRERLYNEGVAYALGGKPDMGDRELLVDETLRLHAWPFQPAAERPTVIIDWTPPQGAPPL